MKNLIENFHEFLPFTGNRGDIVAARKGWPLMIFKCTPPECALSAGIGGGNTRYGLPIIPVIYEIRESVIACRKWEHAPLTVEGLDPLSVYQALITPGHVKTKYIHLRPPGDPASPDYYSGRSPYDLKIYWKGELKYDGSVLKRRREPYESTDGWNNRSEGATQLTLGRLIGHSIVRYLDSSYASLELPQFKPLQVKVRYKADELRGYTDAIRLIYKKDFGFQWEPVPFYKFSVEDIERRMF